jgi:hypothetical protein
LIATLAAMTKRMVLIVVAAVLVVGGVVGAVAFRPSADGAACDATKGRAQSAVHTERWPRPKDLAELGSYTAIHWQEEAASACAAPGAAAKTYQAVVKLRAKDLQALVTKYDWIPADAFDTSTMWPALVEHVPPGVRWHTSWQLDGIMLDPDRAVAYAILD